MPTTADLLFLQAKTAVLEELHCRYEEACATKDWQEALHGIELIMLGVADVLQEAHAVLEKSSTRGACRE
ncbi:MAG: hypothetical protein NNA31_13280 [Nitrospira sp.]|nr:hypothetical protein [Nitrospira sp.]